MSSFRTGLMLFLVGAATWWTATAKSDIALSGGPYLESFPWTIGSWKGSEIDIDELTYGLLESRDVTIRQYDGPDGEIVYLTAAVSSGSRKIAHPAEICYAGTGFTVAERHETTLASRDVVLYEFVKGERREAVASWYQTEGTVTASFVDQQLVLIGRTLIGDPCRASMIRLATPLEAEESLEDGRRRIIAFLEDSHQALERTLP